MSKIKSKVHTGSIWFSLKNHWTGKLALEQKLANRLVNRHFYMALEDEKYLEEISVLRPEIAQASREVYHEILKRSFRLGAEGVYDEPRWWFVGLMTNSDIALSTVRSLRASEYLSIGGGFGII